MTWIDRQDPEKVERALGALRAQKPGYIEREADGDERFALWLANVDARMARMVGVGHGDIADWQWWDSYEAGDSPRAAAVEALEADDLPWPVGGE
ncbi:MAG TPA: hypothetical protein VIU37_05025 [Candidatus Limnocylindrales bacterium]